MSKEIPQVLKGFRDYLPQEQIARRQIISKISEVFEHFGFAPIDTPTLESYSLLAGQIGEDEKLIYKFKDLGDREVALRYDLTLPLARVVASYPDLPKPFKRYQIANAWRAENTQKGRFREFMQCDVDVIGSDSLLADAEVVATINEAFKSLQIGEVVVKFNNRQIVDEVLENIDKVKFLRIIDKLDKVGKEKISAMLSAEGFNVKLDNFSGDMKTKGEKFISEFESYLKDFGVMNFQFDPFLARGLDYYTGTIFEFVLKAKPEFGSVAGGGRYDNLIEKISGKPMSAVGGSIGLDRLFAALTEAGQIPPQVASDVIVFNLDQSLVSKYLKIVTDLRNAGFNTEFYYETAKIEKQFKYAESKNIKLAVIFGTDEAKNDKVNIKDLAVKQQSTVEITNLPPEIKKMLGSK